jgi:UDP-2,3-diacylglucosamine hydrolase
MPTGNKLYFASDFHLGTPTYAASRQREDKIIRWLDMIKNDAAEIFLIGDTFDFWFEYSAVVPKGYVRFLGKLAQLTDAGIKVYLFKGNHDMWMFDYLKQEIGVTIISNELIIERNGKKFYLHHGDGLGPGDTKYKFLKKIFRSNLCQWLFARIHPNLGIGIAGAWSRKSRRVGDRTDHLRFYQHEWLVTYSKDVLKKTYYDYLIFGHRHLPIDTALGTSRYINLGEWLHACTFAVFDGKSLELKHFEKS